MRLNKKQYNSLLIILVLEKNKIIFDIFRKKCYNKINYEIKEIDKMATNKVGLTKLNLKKNTNIIQVEWNDQKIEVKEYLPIEEKLNLIGRIVSYAIDENNFVNPVRFQIFETLEIMYEYTNINFTEKQKEDFLGLYDLIVSSGLWRSIQEVITNEYYEIHDSAKAVVDEIYKFRDSLLGILQAVNEDYKNLDLDATALKDKIGNPENLKLLRTVIDELG